MYDNNPRLVDQNREVEKLERWYESEVNHLDDALINGRLTQAEYNSLIKNLNRTYSEDYADIFAG
jgi:CRISPR/Cas system-associated endoribonuclease Cas2